MPDTRLLCIHQNRLFRQLLVSVLSGEDGYTTAETDGGLNDVLVQIQEFEPSIVLIDIELSHRRAIEIVASVAEEHPATKVVFLIPGARLPEEHRQVLVECIEAGADGFILEESSMDELRRAIAQVIRGQKFYAQGIVEAMFEELSNLSREARWRRGSSDVKLTQRELDVLGLVAEGMSNQQIADQLSVSLFTIKNHVHNILDKLKVGDRHAAVQRALDNRWIAIRERVHAKPRRTIPTSDGRLVGLRPSASTARSRSVSTQLLQLDTSACL